MISAGITQKIPAKGAYPFVVCLALFVSLVSTSAWGASDAYPFTKGSARFSLLLGSATAFEQDYTVFGLGIGYYVMDGLEAGIDYETWQGNTPHINRLSPGVRYIFYARSTLKPYVGAFYRRVFIENYKDQNDAGARAGAVLPVGQRAYLGAGAVYDAHLNCDRSIYTSCSQVYPELLFAFVF